MFDSCDGTGLLPTVCMGHLLLFTLYVSDISNRLGYLACILFYVCYHNQQRSLFSGQELVTFWH